MLSFQKCAGAIAVGSLAVIGGLVAAAPAAVPQGSPEKARAYYRALSESLGFNEPTTILNSTLADIPRYLGYEGLSSQDFEQLSSSVLMDAARLGRACDTPTPCEGAVQNAAEFQRNFAVLPLRAGDILASRFLAPKIANVSEGAQTRGIGWRKLVRLRARRGSAAAKHGISDGVILFNFFTKPGEKPFQPGAESVNTQVMLLVTPRAFANGKDSLYWLDYGRLSGGGQLSLQLDAAFDAGDLQGGEGAIKPYFVPDGCVACHGENARRPTVNYLGIGKLFAIWR